MKTYNAITLTALLITLLICSSSFGQQKSRVDMSDMQIRGQTKNADTLYMFDRGKLQPQSLVEVRKDYRKEIQDKMFQ